jgi:hypothetical protein
LEHLVRYTLRERAPGGLPDGQSDTIAAATT